MSKRILGLALAMVLAAGLLAGCSTPTAPSAATPAPAANAEPVEISVYIASEPQTIDPQLNTSADGNTYNNHLFQTLAVYGPDGKTWVGGAAEKWDVSDDQMTYTFHLRKDGKWSDGKPVTANDFVHTFRRLVDPKTAAEYANMVYDYVENGKAVFDGEKPVTDLGVRAVDDYTFEVKLFQPCSFYIEVASFGALCPTREDVVSNEQWTQTAATHISNGRYKLVEWKHDSEIVVERNPHYWDNASTKVDKITFKLMADSTTALAAFRAGELMYADTVPPAEVAALKTQGVYSQVNQLTTYYISFQTQKAPFDNAKVRKAFSLAIDRAFITEKITMAGQQPATGIVPWGMNEPDPSMGEFYVNSQPNLLTLDYEAAKTQAKQLLAEAGYPDGKGIPVIEYMYNDSPAHKAIGEALQQMWKDVQGVEIELAMQEWNVFLDTRHKGDYQVARNGWNADYAHPMTMLELFMSENGNNDGKYNSAEFDKLLNDARAAKTPQEQSELMHKAEVLLCNTDAACAPIYFYTAGSIMVPEMTDLIKTPMSKPLFYNCKVKK